MDPWEFRRIFQQLKCFGELVAPRGQKVLELQNFNWTFPAYVRWMSFDDRKLKLSYVKAELRWYLNGDPKDNSIDERAKMWAEIRDVDGKVNSNYGHYFFRRGQIAWCIEQLQRDPDSRRASAMILQPEHLRFDNRDVPCTYGMNFRVRNGKLFASVHMRSQDAIWGLGNDLPFFSFVQELVAVYLGYEMGSLHLAVDSFHIYEKHWPMLEAMYKPGSSPWRPIYCPRLSGPAEVRNLLTMTPDLAHPNHFTYWLHTEDVCDPTSTRRGSTLPTSSPDKEPASDVA